MDCDSDVFDFGPPFARSCDCLRRCDDALECDLMGPESSFEAPKEKSEDIFFPLCFNGAAMMANIGMSAPRDHRLCRCRQRVVM